MDISRYLAELIKLRKKVIVPGFGTFFKEEIPAKYDANSNSFLPPRELITFSNDFTEDETLLNFISKKEKTNKKSATYFLEQYVSNLNDLLASTEEIKIDSLGTFRKSDDNYLFEADSLLSPPGFYGLMPQRELEEAWDEAAEGLPDDQTTEESEEQPRILKKSILVFIILLLILLTALQIFYPGYLDSLQGIRKEITEKPVPVVNQPGKPSIVDTAAQKDTAVLNAAKDTSLTIENSKPSYEIIIAAFGTRAESETFINQLSRRGINARALENKPKEYIKISVASFTNVDSAQSELKKIQNELSKNAWIYYSKPLKNQPNVTTTN